MAPKAAPKATLPKAIPVPEAEPTDALAQATAQAAAYGAQASETVQEWMGWLGTSASAQKKKSRKPVTAPLKAPTPVAAPPKAAAPKAKGNPPKAILSAPKAAMGGPKASSAKAVAPKAAKNTPPMKEDEVDGFEPVQLPQAPPPPRDPNASPRQRPPGKPPAASAQELRNDSSVPAEKDDELVLIKRDLIVKSTAATPLMPFTLARKPITRLHPSVMPRHEGLSSEDTALISDVVEDPDFRKEATGVDKIIQSRQFIEAMRKSLEQSKAQINLSTNSPRLPFHAPGGDRPISPMQENISSVAFLPLPYEMCRTCGFYRHSCVCSSGRVPSQAQTLRRGLQRVVDRIDSPASVPSDEGEGVEAIPARVYLRPGASFRSGESQDG